MRKGIGIMNNHREVIPEMGHTGCLRNYRKSILYLRTSVLGRLRDLQYIFAITYETLCTFRGPGSRVSDPGVLVGSGFQ